MSEHIATKIELEAVRGGVITFNQEYLRMKVEIIVLYFRTTFHIWYTGFLYYKYKKPVYPLSYNT